MLQHPYNTLDMHPAVTLKGRLLHGKRTNMTYITPIHKINSYSTNNNIYLKREDLLPVAFGGNKVRIALEFMDDMRKKGRNTMVGYGNSRSNMCRALVVLCRMKNIPCHIISSGDDDGEYQKTWNECIVHSMGAVIHRCRKTEVAETVEDVCSEISRSGNAPYYIYGNQYGKGNEATPLKAYEKVYSEISDQASEILGSSRKFDYIFLPAGTGMTQSGLLAGRQKKHGKEKIIGISVARDSQKESEMIADSLKCCFGRDIVRSDDIIVTDSYLKGGYARFDDQIADTIRTMMAKEGIALDPVYTGKGFNGMLEYLEENHIANKNILYILTGSVPLFFDYGMEIFH